MVIGALVKLPALLQWLPGALVLAGDAIWVTLRLALGRSKKKQTNFFSGSQTVFARVARETNEAVDRYLGAVVRKGLLGKSALYERPWFLLCGGEKSGKTSLLRGAGLNFRLRYPSEKDGMVLDGPGQITWHFANEAVWIDTPGALMSDEGKDTWQAFVASLSHVRPERPVDGVALVVSAADVLNADDRMIKEMASTLRRRIDELIAAWTIEFPVYLVFNHADGIPGFAEYFGDQLTRAQEQIFGATLSADLDKMLPRIAFAQEFSLLCRSLTDLRVDKLYKEKDEARRRMICRFVIHFEGIQEKLGAFAAELFKPSSYEGRPLFRGFYFTSCIEIASGESRDETARQPDVGQTIASHPLNPRRMLSPEALQPKAAATSEVKSLFVLPLFRELMVRGKELVTATQKRTRRQFLRHYLITAGIAAAACLIVGLMVSGLFTSRELLESVQADLSAAPPSAEGGPLGQFASLDAEGKAVARLQGYEDRGAPVLAWAFGFYRGREALDRLRVAYFAKINSLIVSPAVKYLEYQLWDKVQGYGELAGPDYDNLYSALKAYLSISETMTGRPKDIDTVFLRPVLLDAIQKSLMSVQNGAARLPEQVEKILSENMGVYLLFLKRQAIPPIQENQRLVTLARTKLRRLPSAQALYESVINRVSQDAPSISLDQILARKEEGILKAGRAISVLYTQEGWDKFVADAVARAAADPFKLDWVIGLSADQVPGETLDKKKLYADMVAAYLADFTSQWLGFIASVKIDPFGDLGRTQRILLKLTAEKSELAVLLATVADYTVLKKESVADKAGGAVLDAASKVPGGQALAATAAKAQNEANKAEGALAFSLGQKSPFDDLNATFDPLRSFARSTGGALSGYEGYRDKIQTLASKIAALETQGEDNAPAVFTGRDDDPLLCCWKFSQAALANMPDNLASSLKGVLMQPVDNAAAAAASVLTRALTARWHSEIVKPFTAKFSGKYPFSPRGEDAAFADVMDFFRPQTGTFWGFYDRVLTPYLVKTASGWMVKPVGSLALNFNPQLASSLVSAERVRDIFFKPDGTVRPLSITMTPSASNKNSAKLEVNGQTFDLAPGGRPVTVTWPNDATPPGAALKISVSSDFTQDISFGGQWGFLRLMQVAHVNKLNASTLNARWQSNVQNMYMVVMEYRVQVSGTDHPFGDPVFSEFNCPTELFVGEGKK